MSMLADKAHNNMHSKSNSEQLMHLCIITVTHKDSRGPSIYLVKDGTINYTLFQCIL